MIGRLKNSFIASVLCAAGSGVANSGDLDEFYKENPNPTPKEMVDKFLDDYKDNDFAKILPRDVVTIFVNKKASSNNLYVSDETKADIENNNLGYVLDNATKWGDSHVVFVSANDLSMVSANDACLKADNSFRFNVGDCYSKHWQITLNNIMGENLLINEMVGDSRLHYDYALKDEFSAIRYELGADSYCSVNMPNLSEVTIKRDIWFSSIIPEDFLVIEGSEASNYKLAHSILGFAHEISHCLLEHSKIVNDMKALSRPYSDIPNLLSFERGGYKIEFGKLRDVLKHNHEVEADILARHILQAVAEDLKLAPELIHRVVRANSDRASLAFLFDPEHASQQYTDGDGQIYDALDAIANIRNAMRGYLDAEGGYTKTPYDNKDRINDYLDYQMTIDHRYTYDLLSEMVGKNVFPVGRPERRFVDRYISAFDRVVVQPVIALSPK